MQLIEWVEKESKKCWIGSAKQFDFTIICNKEYDYELRYEDFLTINTTVTVIIKATHLSFLHEWADKFIQYYNKETGVT